MITLQNIQKRIDKANDIKDALFCYMLGFNSCIDDFMRNKPDDELPIEEIIRISIEIAKGGYGLSDDYRLNDEYVLRYFCITAMLMVYLTLPQEAHTFTSVDYLCDVFDNDYDQFEKLSQVIQNETFKKYYDLLMLHTRYIVSPLKGTFDALLVAYLDKQVLGGYIEEMSELISNDIETYINNNTYDDILTEMLDNNEE